MSRRLTCAALALLTAVGLMAVSLTGCAATHPAPDEQTRAESLWSSRTRYVGDNSAVAALVSAVDPAPEGNYDISLNTATRPYGLTIALEHTDKPFDATDFSEPATLLLGLVDNLDAVSVTFQGQAYTLTADAASKDLGYDVKMLGRHRDQLTAYLNTQRD